MNPRLEFKLRSWWWQGRLRIDRAVRKLYSCKSALFGGKLRMTPMEQLFVMFICVNGGRCRVDHLKADIDAWLLANGWPTRRKLRCWKAEHAVEWRLGIAASMALLDSESRRSGLSGHSPAVAPNP